MFLCSQNAMLGIDWVIVPLSVVACGLCVLTL